MVLRKKLNSLFLLACQHSMPNEKHIPTLATMPQATMDDYVMGKYGVKANCPEVEENLYDDCFPFWGLPLPSFIVQSLPMTCIMFVKYDYVNNKQPFYQNMITKQATVK